MGMRRVSAGKSFGAVLAVALCAVSATAGAQEFDGDSFAALAYLRVPFTAKPYVGVALQKDRIEASRPAARDYEPLWAQPRVLDVHLNPQTMQPVRINGREVYGDRAGRTVYDLAWSAPIEQ